MTRRLPLALAGLLALAATPIVAGITALPVD